MTRHLDRREFIQLAGLATAGVAGVVFSSGLRGVSLAAAKGRGEDFMFLQMSDLHWGFTGPAVNPDAEGTLDKAIAHVNALPHQPDFIVFTGDLTHTTDDDQERRKRLAHVRDAVGKLKVKKQRYLAGEHDASLDRAAAFKEGSVPTSGSSTRKPRSSCSRTARCSTSPPTGTGRRPTARRRSRRSCRTST